MEHAQTHLLFLCDTVRKAERDGNISYGDKMTENTGEWLMFNMQVAINDVRHMSTEDKIATVRKYYNLVSRNVGR